MRFSLKDLMWSVTLACIGLAAFAPIYYIWNIEIGEASPEFVLLAYSIVLFPGAMFGAAIGKLYHRAWRGSVLGLVVVAAWLMAMSFVMARIN